MSRRMLVLVPHIVKISRDSAKVVRIQRTTSKHYSWTRKISGPLDDPEAEHSVIFSFVHKYRDDLKATGVLIGGMAGLIAGVTSMIALFKEEKRIAVEKETKAFEKIEAQKAVEAEEQRLATEAVREKLRQKRKEERAAEQVPRELTIYLPHSGEPLQGLIVNGVFDPTPRQSSWTWSKAPSNSCLCGRIKYEGDIRDGKPEGHGVLTMQGKYQCTGSFLSGAMSGGACVSVYEEPNYKPFIVGMFLENRCWNALLFDRNGNLIGSVVEGVVFDINGEKDSELNINNYERSLTELEARVQNEPVSENKVRLPLFYETIPDTDESSAAANEHNKQLSSDLSTVMEYFYYNNGLLENGKVNIFHHAVVFDKPRLLYSATVSGLFRPEDVNNLCWGGHTPLFLAVELGRIEMIPLLVDFGADLSVKCHNKTPLQLAKEIQGECAERSNIVALLQKLEAELI